MVGSVVGLGGWVEGSDDDNNNDNDEDEDEEEEDGGGSVGNLVYKYISPLYPV